MKKNYLKTLRLKSGLLQKDASQLLGISRQTLSLIESRRELPPYEAILAARMVFKAEVTDMIPDEIHRIESLVAVRAEKLYRELKTQAESPKLFARLQAIKQIADTHY